MLGAYDYDVLYREFAVEVVLVDPVVQVVKGLWLGDIKHQYAAVRAPIVASC